MKVVVINWKGGVGKTTVSAQVLPVMFKELGCVPFAFTEVDILNREVQKYENKLYTDNGKIAIEKLSLNPESLEEDLFKLLSYENVIIDTGANEISKTFAEKLSEMAINEEIDKVFIPVEAYNKESISKGSEVTSLFPYEKVVMGIEQNRLKRKTGKAI
jgi:GTPase involved in cell partitioning and DNA repair